MPKVDRAHPFFRVLADTTLLAAPLVAEDVAAITETFEVAAPMLARVVTPIAIAMIINDLTGGSVSLRDAVKEHEAQKEVVLAKIRAYYAAGGRFTLSE